MDSKESKIKESKIKETIKRSSGLCLAIDPGSRLGWAVFNIETKSLVEAGEIHTDTSNPLHDRRFQMENELHSLFGFYQPDKVIVEDVSRSTVGLKNVNAIVWLVASQYMVTREAYKQRAELVEVHPATLKKGMGIIVRKKIDPLYTKDQVKVQMLEKVNSSGLYPEVIPKTKHNMADAIALGMLHLGVVGGKEDE